MKLYYYESGQFEKATGASIFAESNNSNIVQFKLPMVTEGSVVYATFLLPFSQNTDQYGQYKAESLLLTKVVDDEDGGFMYQGTLAEGYLVNNGTAYICARIQAPEGLAVYTASSASSITIGDKVYTISYTSTTPAMLKLTDTNSNVFQSLDNKSILVDNAIFLIGEDENEKLTLTTDLTIKTTEQVQFKIQAGGGYTATAVLPEMGEQLALAIASIESTLYSLSNDKQDKDTANTDNVITTNAWQTSTVVVTAINNIISQVATNKSDIATNANNISNNAGEIATIKQQMITSETYIGTMPKSATPPTSEDLTSYVQSKTGHNPKPGDYVYFTLQISGATDKNYKYTYSAVTGWGGSEIPTLEEAGNGSLGIIEGTYNVGDTNDTLVDIVGGKIKNIYIKDNSNNYRNIVEYANATNTTIASIIAGSQTVGKALQAISDGLGNNIVNTYLTQTAGATKQYVRQYALPREFNDIYFIDADGYSTSVPTTPVSGIQFTVETDSVGDHQLFLISKQEDADYELSNKNSARTVIYVAADNDCTVQFRLTTQAQHSGGAWKTLCIDLTQAIDLTANTITKVEFTEPFTNLGNEVITITDGDFIRQQLEVVTETSSTLNFDIYSNATYTSSFALNMQTIVLKTLAGSLGEEQSLLAIGTAVTGGVDFALDTDVVLKDNTSVEFRLHYAGVLADTDVVTLSLDSQDLGLTTPYGGNVLAKQLKQCYYSTDGSTETDIRFKGFVNVDSGNNVTIKIEEDNLNAIKYGANLNLSGTSLQLQDQNGNSLGSAVTLPETGITSVQTDGEGNAFTSQSVSGGVLTLTKGTTFATPADVADAINSVSAYYITRNSNGDPFQTYAQLSGASTFYSGGVVRTPTTNDYCIVLADITEATIVSGYDSFTTTAEYVGYYVLYNNTSTLVTNANKDSVGITAGTTICYLSIPTTRYSYQNNQWEFQFIVSEASFTTEQWAAINSGLTATDKTKLDGIASGAEVNVIDGIKVDGTALTPDANKDVAITLPPGTYIGTSTNWGSSTTTAYLRTSYFSGGIIPTKEGDLVYSTGTRNLHRCGTVTWDSVEGAYKTTATFVANFPAPTVNNATITITQGGVEKGSFTLNQASDETVALDAAGGDVTDVQVDSVSVVTTSVANVNTINGNYDGTTNKLATASDLPAATTLTTTSGSEAITVGADTLNIVTRNTDQNITSTKTFVGQQKVKFKQSSASDKLGFTLYNSSNKEISSLQYSSRSMRPIGSGSSTSYDFLALQNYTGDAANYHATQVGFRSMSDDTSSQKAFNFLVPKDTKANMNAVYGSDYDTIYLNTAITDGTKTEFADKKGVVNISNVLGSLATPNLTDSTAHTQTGHATVVESYLSSNKQVWYRLWSDGFKEQYYHWTGSSNEPQFAFPIAFSNTKYITVANASVDGYISAVRPQSQTVNSVNFRIGEGGTIRTAIVLDIYCAGY